FEVQRPDSVRMLAKVAPRAAPFPHRLGADDYAATGLEHRRPLLSLLLELLAAAAQLGEVDRVGVEAPTALEIVDVVVDRLQGLDAQRLARRHRGTSRLLPCT